MEQGWHLTNGRAAAENVGWLMAVQKSVTLVWSFKTMAIAVKNRFSGMPLWGVGTATR